MKSKLKPILLSILLFSENAAAVAMMCGTTFVDLGDTEYTVLDKCGVPTFVNDEDVFFGERWIYDQGPGTLLKIITFRNGKVQNIETGERQ